MSHLADLALRLGQDVTLAVTSAGTAALNGTVSGQTTTTMSGVRAVVETVRASMVDGVSVLRGDLLLLVPAQAALTTAPVAGMTTASGAGIDARVYDVRVLRRLGVVEGYELLARGVA